MNAARRLFTAVLTLLLIVGTQRAQAQAVQDALYIFRNDGMFNAFFFGDIDHFSYSKIDTLGVEHDDYVTQEVWALDTVYRIPISAIDSISFVTPENKVKSDVFCPDPSIADYIIASDSLWWIRLAPNTPKSLIPKVDEKILIDEGSKFIPNGFAGTVIVVDQSDDGYFVAASACSLADLYERLVIKEAGSTPSADGQVKSERRSDFDGTIYWDVPEFELPEISFEESLSLTNKTALTADGSPVSISWDVSGSYTQGLKLKMKVRSLIFIDPLSGFQIDEKFVFDHETSTSLSLSGAVNGRWELGYHKEAPEYQYKELKYKVGVGLFIEGSISGFSLGGTWKSAGQTVCHIAANQRDLELIGTMPILNPQITISSTPKTKDFEFTAEEPKNIDGFNLPKQVSIGAGIYAKVFTDYRIPLNKGKMPEIVYNFLKKYVPKDKADALKKDSVGFHFEIGADLGGKVDMKAPWWLIGDDTPFEQSQPIYKELNDETEFNWTLYSKIGASISVGPWELAKPYQASVSGTPKYLVPKFTGISANIDKDEKPMKPYRIKIATGLSRDLLFPNKVGFLILDEDGEPVEKWCELSYFSEKAFDYGLSYFKNGIFSNTFSLDPGRGDEEAVYYISPMVKLSTGRELLTDIEKEIRIDPARIEISQRQFVVDVKDGYDHGEYVGFHQVEVVPNMENLQVKAEANWLRDVTWWPNDNELRFNWSDLPEGVKERRGVIRLTGLSKKGVELCEDSIVVIQAAPIMELDPKELKFGIPGGVQQVTIVETNLTDLSLFCPSDYVHASLNKNVITVNVDPNPGESRGTYVTIYGTAPNGELCQNSFDVKQEGDDEPGPGPEPDDSPFNYLYFWTQRTTRYISDTDGAMDTTTTVWPRFNFTPENTTKFSMKNDGDIVHFVLEGYEEQSYNESKTRAILAFDVDKKANKVKNLNFSSENEYAIKVHMMLYDSYSSIKTNIRLTLSDFPLQKNSSTYMESEWTVGKGLQFTSFTCESNISTTYTSTTGGDYLPPETEHITYSPVGSPEDYVGLWISLKSEDSNAEWPTDEMMQTLQNAGMPIYYGDTPPDVTGTYYFSPIKVVADPQEQGEGMEYADGMVFKFSDQDNGKLKFNTYTIFGGFADEATDDMPAYIMGDGKKFTICVPEEEGTYVLFSGELKNGGITSLHFSFIEDSYNYLIMKDGDGSSTTTPWAPGEGEYDVRKQAPSTTKLRFPFKR